MRPACCGSSSAANRKKDLIAVSLRLRLRAPFVRVRSRSSRNSPINGAFRSSIVSFDAGLASRRATNCSRSRNVSRYDATVCGLALRCAIRRVVKNISRRAGNAAFVGTIRPPNAGSGDGPRLPSVLACRSRTSRCRSHGHGQDTWTRPADADERHHLPGAPFSSVCTANRWRKS